MIRLRVKEVAQAKGMTVAKLGRMADLNQRTIQTIYNDPYRNIAYNTLSKLAKALDVSISELIEEVPNGSTE